MQAQRRLRAATVDDAVAVVPWLVEAQDHLARALAGVAQWHSAVPLFHALYLARDNRYSYRHVRVLEHEGAVAAAILAYPGRDEAALAAATLACLREHGAVGRFQPVLESSPDEFYLDAVAVAPTQRGQGHAAWLIDAVCAQARTAGHCRAGLLVDEAKPGIRRLYQSLGFVVDGERCLAGQRHEHMVRDLTC